MNFDKEVRTCFGNEVADYVSRKLVGGNNGKKGARYEDYFSAYRVAVEVGRLIEDSRGLPTFHQQAEAIVDDLVVGWDERTDYYQCKNAAHVSWSAGEHPISKDFQLQFDFCRSTERPEARTILVVSSADEADRLSDAVPASIASHTGVEHFPHYGESMNRLVIECEKLRTHLSLLTRLANPSDDELVNALGALLIGLLEHEGEVAGGDVVAKAQSVSPHLIRLLPAQEAEIVLDPKVRSTLDAIPGLEYRIDRGFFSWSGCGMEGIFPSSCLSEEFAKFQRRVVATAPTTIEEFEVLS